MFLSFKIVLLPLLPDYILQYLHEDLSFFSDPLVGLLHGVRNVDLAVFWLEEAIVM
jgi:hypothetical protein